MTIDASGSDPTPDLNQNDGSQIFYTNLPFGSATIDVQISGFTLTGGDPLGPGGAIFSNERLLASNLVLTGNWAASGGAIAIGINSADSTVTDCTITGNTAGDGGAIFVQGVFGAGTVTISKNLISGNSATRGGAIFAFPSPNDSLVIIDDTITGNSASFKGGAAFLANPNGPTTTVRDSKLSGNSAVQQGGAIYASGARDFSIVDSEISDNHATSPTASRGGGVYSNSGDVAISGSTITGNTAAAGGGVYSRNGELAIEFTTVQGNLASAGNGGGILSNTDRLTLVGSSISGNSASGPGAGGRGGGLWHAITTVGPSTILDTDFTSNSSTLYGGGVYIHPDPRYAINAVPLALTNVTISGNSSGRGGGLATGLGTVATGGAIILNGGTISGNTSAKDGGGIYSRLLNLTVNGTTISGNHAGANGGGIATPASGVQTLQLSFIGATITGNSTGESNDGGGIWIPVGTSTTSLISTTISGNSAFRGGGIFRGTAISQGSITAVNSTLSGNKAAKGGGRFTTKAASCRLLDRRLSATPRAAKGPAAGAAF